MYNIAVIGLGFGDEGKGMVTASLCAKSVNPCVIRFSGGHQAGHTVVHNNKRHVFTNFGSGTLHGVPTYWSPKCTVEPVGIVNELRLLKKHTAKIRLHINDECPVTTPFDIRNNQHSYKSDLHGTCGVGVGATFQREEDHYHLHFADLFNTTVLKIKLDLIRDYYGYLEANIDNFLEAVEIIRKEKGISHSLFNQHITDCGIYEGSQGLLLDQEIGFFPHVTRSNLAPWDIKDNWLQEVYYVTRAYQTRHGNGPMTNEDIPLKLINTEDETNVNNDYQGEFRRTVLDLDLLSYSLRKRSRGLKDNLVVTCLDQLTTYQYTFQGKLVTCENEREFIRGISAVLGPFDIYLSRSPDSTIEKLLN